MKHIVFLTGAGMSVESGFKTFRGNDGLWENYPVEQVASHEGWLKDPTLVTNFYNMMRRKLYAAQPNEGHRLIHELEKDYKVTVITQNVDNLHEKAGSTDVNTCTANSQRYARRAMWTTLATSVNCPKTTAKWFPAHSPATVRWNARTSSSSAKQCR